MTSNINFAQVLEQLMDQKYRRNRAELAATAHISPSALSQYVRGRATPSLDVLVSLADALDVSLEYLVFGKERAAAPLELGFLTAHLESHIRSSQAQAASLHDLVSRIGDRIGEVIHSTAMELLPKASTLAGLLTPAEIFKLERCSKRITIATTDLSHEVLVISDQDKGSVGAPSVFAQIVADNLRDGSVYEYIVPQGASYLQTADLLRQEVMRLGNIEPRTVDRQLQIYHVSNACTPGYVIQHFDMKKLQRRAPGIYERIENFIKLDTENTNLGFVAYSEIVSVRNQYFALIKKVDVPRLLKDVEIIRKRQKQKTSI
jgi:transcriptional regulator with XRE-family HTH domain